MKKWKYVIVLILTAAMIGISGYSSFAQPEGVTEETAEKDPAVIKALTEMVEAVHMMQNGTDLFDGETLLYEGATLEVALNYNVETDPPVEAGDRLSVKLAAADSQKDFLVMDYVTSTLKVLEDKGVTLAELDLSDRRGVEFLFNDVKVSFRAKIDMPFKVNEAALTEYFNGHPGEESVLFQYKLQYDGKDTGRVLNLELRKREVKPAEVRFVKTRGIYQQEGNLGEGRLLYNVYLGTKLRRSNEFIIYDTPDVNHSFDGDIRIYVPKSYAGLNNNVLSRKNYYIEEGNLPEEEKMEIFISDIYYLTEPAVDQFMPQQADFEEMHVTFPRKNPSNETVGLQSMDTVTVPKNILVEKPMGEALTEDEKALIEKKGGLYRTCGKGFKIRVKNLKGREQNPGGYMSLVYTTTIRGNSPKLDEKGYPVYYNTACYYGQEIPTCKPGDENCTPIMREKTALSAVINGFYTTEGKVTPGSVSADVDEYSQVEFLKTAAGSQGEADLQRPLGGAVFNIYQVQADGSRQIAENKEHVRMENLITDDAGKLCMNDDKKTKIKLWLKRGSYIFEEVTAPEGWQIVEKERSVTVGLLDNQVIIANRKAEDSGNGGQPEQPEVPQNPYPQNPQQPQNPVFPNKPPASGDQNKPEKPNQTEEIEKPEKPWISGRPDGTKNPGVSQKHDRAEASDKAEASGKADEKHTVRGQKAVKETPETGDHRKLLLWCGIFIAAISVMMAVVYRPPNKKRK